MFRIIANCKKRDVIKKFSTIIFYIALFVEILIVLIDKSSFINPIEGRLFQISFCMFLIKILLTKYSKLEYFLMALFLILGLLIDYYGDRNEIVRFVVAAFACKDIDITKGLKFVFWIQSIGCLIITFASMLGIYGALTVEKEYQNYGNITRYCFGMGNANSFHTMFFVTVLLGLYLYGERIRWWGYFLLVVSNCVLYLLTDCKTATVLVFMVIVFFALIPVLKKHALRHLKNIIKISIAINALLLLLSVYFAAGASDFCYYYWNSINDELPNPPYIFIFFNKLLTGRILSLTEYNFHGTIESWTWFTVPDHNVYFDMGWVRLFYWYGIIPAIIMIIALSYIIVWMYKNQKYKELMVVLFVLFHMFVEAHFVSVYIGRSYILLIIGMLLPDILTVPKKVGNNE